MMEMSSICFWPHVAIEHLNVAGETEKLNFYFY